jgi:hypothetical protein
MVDFTLSDSVQRFTMDFKTNFLLLCLLKGRFQIRNKANGPLCGFPILTDRGTATQLLNQFSHYKRRKYVPVPVEQLEGVISRLIASAFGTDLNPKIISCLQAYRCLACLKIQLSVSNEGLQVPCLSYSASGSK